jgi:NADPH-dependent 2,4-dienoyl-CoA reductase/sulfur reductase-like enzyme
LQKLSDSLRTGHGSQNKRLETGMHRDLPHSFDILVIGGGPAGIAAAVRAAEGGAQVGIVDDNAALGGQIWRGDAEGGGSKGSARWRELFRAAEITKLYGKRVFHAPESGVLLAEGSDDLCELRYQKLVLATGARERFLPFPGWTLPNVMGAGGLQAMVKSGLPIQGKRVVIAGSGPLLLAVAAYLRAHGAEIPLICEQASWSRMARFGAALLAYPGKIAQGLQLKRELGVVPFAPNSWPLAAHGREKLESVTISRAGKSEAIPCDYLACGFHLVPNLDLQQLLGCQIKAGYVKVDDLQQTTVKDVFCAGEPTGIGGVELALVEGQIAGYAAAGNPAAAQKLFREREKARRFAGILDRTFHLRPELRALPAAETLVCRCEDVSYSRLQKQTSWRAAKLHTRCGMGPCQGRVCGPAVQFLFKWSPDSVRPPIFPARVENLAFISSPEPVSSAVTGGIQ